MIKMTKLCALMLFLANAIVFTSCKDSEDPSPLEVSSITATGTDLVTGQQITEDLNATTSSTNVPLDAVITIEFTGQIDATTATTTNIMLNDGVNDVAISISVNGMKAIVTPTIVLEKGTNYTVKIDGSLFVTTTRVFKSAGKKLGVIPQASKLVVHLPFEGDVVDAKGHEILNDNVTFGADRFGNFASAADFNGTTNYVGVKYNADMSNASTTVSYWVKFPSSADHMAHVGTTSTSIQQFVTFCIGGNNGTYHEWNRFTCCDFGYDIDVLKYFTNHMNSGSASALAGSHIEMKNEGTPGGDKVVEVKNLTWMEDNMGEWMHIVTSWDASTHTKSFYINGVPSTVYKLTPSVEYSLDAATIDVEGIATDNTNNSNLYLGSGVPYWATIDGNGIKPFRGDKAFAFKGQMDEFRMFNVALTDAEVKNLYDAEKP